MSYFESQTELQKLILAGYPLIYVVSDDERPIVETMKIISDRHPTDYHLVTWNSTSGMVNENTNERKLISPDYMLSEIIHAKHDGIFILHDFHVFLKNNEQVILLLKEAVLSIKEPFTSAFSLKRYENMHHEYSKHIIITAPEPFIPNELNKLVNLVYFGLPGRKEVGKILDEISKESSKSNQLSREEREDIISASLGLTETEIMNAYAYSMIENGGKIDAKTITKQKKQIIEKNGLLEYEEPNFNLDDVGGLKELLEWVRKRKIAYDEKIREKYQLDYPKGLLMTGVQGCGKSFTAKAISSFLGVPFLKLDIGTMMNKWVGESESNIRKALKLAEGIAPCVLFMDEIEKGIADPSSGDSHEVSNRILSTLLTWLQEKTSPVFVIATSNNIDKLPPEFMRKGRFDEIFFIDLPDHESKKDILALKLKKKGQNPNRFDLDRIARACDGFSGSEIESAVNEALFEAAYLNTKLTEDLLLKEIERTNPLSKTMADKVNKIREWAEKHGIRKAG